MINTVGKSSISRHWFVLLAPFVVASNALVVSVGPIDRVIEIGVVFDFVVLIPAMYLICYRSRTKKPYVKALGLACLGVWMATKMVPESNRMVLTYLEPVRFVGLFVLVLVELALVRMIYRLLSSGGTSEAVTERITANEDVPNWVARLLVWETQFWKRLFRIFRGLLTRRRDDTK